MSGIDRRVINLNPGGHNGSCRGATVTKTIYKYELMGPKAKIDIPMGGRVLTAHEQRGRIQLWVEVVVGDLQMEERTFQAIGTGHKFDDLGLFYIATVFMENGLVWHIYENRRVDG